MKKFTASIRRPAALVAASLVTWSFSCLAQPAAPAAGEPAGATVPVPSVPGGAAVPTAPGEAAAGAAATPAAGARGGRGGRRGAAGAAGAPGAAGAAGAPRGATFPTLINTPAAQTPYTLTPNLPPKQMEKLGRGVVVLNEGEGKVWMSWRLLGTDPDDLAFNVYRVTDNGIPVKLNGDPIAKVTWFEDTTADLTKANAWYVRPVLAGKEDASQQSKDFLNKLGANAPVRNYISVPLQTPAGYQPNDASVADLDGDGEYEIILHQVGRGQDNAFSGFTTPPIFQAYKMDGTLLWTVNLGPNVREGAHYTQFMVFDFDGDGKAEMICKTADGTVDGTGKVIGDPKADWVERGHKFTATRDRTGSTTDENGNLVAGTDGRIMSGPEYLTVFDGMTGKALQTVDYVPARGNVSAWGDDYENRADRFLAAVAYLDGVHPSAVFCRGYYTRTVIAAWDWRDGKLSQRWVFDSDDPAHPENRPYRGNGNHNMSVADVDGDGRQDIVYGAMCVDSYGKGLYTTGLGHGDTLHVSDMDPDRPGLEVFDIHENPRHPFGMELRDAKSGQMIWGSPGGTTASPDVGRGVAFDVDPRYPGYEMWSSLPGMYNAKGERIGDRKPSVNFGVWWDGDYLREMLDGQNNPQISKWDWVNQTSVPLLRMEGTRSNNGTKATPTISGDLFGDWREEVVNAAVGGQELRIYTTTIPTEHRLYTLMHDPQYRVAIAWQNTAYNQPPHPGFFLGEGMKGQPKANIFTDPVKPAAK